MKKILLYITILSLIVLAIACEKVIQIDLEDAKIKIVVNGIISPDSIVKVNVTRSRHVLDNADISPLVDAEVLLYEDGQLIGNMTYAEHGFYEIDYVPIIGKEYKVEVHHDKYDNVMGLTKVIPSIPIISLDTVTSFDEYGEEVLSFSMSFSDPVDQENYYYLTIRNKYTYEDWDPNLIVYDTLYVGSDTTIVNIEHGGYVMKERMDYLGYNTDDIIVESQMYYANGSIFSDEIINGKTYTFTGKISKWAFGGEYNTAYFELHAITEGTYNYYKSLNSHYIASDDPFAEPVIVYTNIEDGIGIFGSSTVYSDSISVAGYGGFYEEF